MANEPNLEEQDSVPEHLEDDWFSALSFWWKIYS